jgi:hypothetical protein
MIATPKDIVATALVAGAGLVTWAHVQEWDWPVVGNARWAAVIVLVLGTAACAVGSQDVEVKGAKKWHQRVGPTVGGLAGLAAIVAIITGWTSWLVAATVLLVALWFVTTVRHLVTRKPARESARQPLAA